MVRGDRPSDPSALFPHEADYDAALAHGADALALGAAACADCHDTQATGTSPSPSASTGGPPPCAECHAGYPHVQGWAAGDLHGVGTWGEGGDRSACETCHAAPGLVATDRFACDSCHASWPHPEGWALAGNHGIYALARGSSVAACGSCHGADLTGGDVGVGCTDCHATWPHPEGWALGTGHPDAARKDMTSCTGCHGEDGADPGATGGTSGVACSQCHAGFPHAEGWREGGHMTGTWQVGEGACAVCHDPGEGPSNLVMSCAARCHGGEETGW